MNRKFIFLVIVLSLICCSELAKADDIEIIIPETTVLAYTGRANELQLSVKNNGPKDTFYFSIWPSEWVSLKKYWTILDTGEAGEISFTITPPRDAEEETLVFTVTVKSVDEEVSDSKQLYVRIKRETTVYISEIKINKQTLKPYETLTIQPVITNIDKQQTSEVSITTKILKDDLLLKKFDDDVSLEPNSMETLEHSFDIQMIHPPGSYDIVVSVRDTLNKLLDDKKVVFKIDRIYEMDEKKTIKYGLFFSKVMIEVTNKGNVPKADFSVTESIPVISRYFFYPEVEPITEMKKDNRMVYTWYVEGLDPGKSERITYQLRFTNIILISVIGVILFVFLFSCYFGPAMMKRYKGLLTNQKEIIVSLHVKNKTRGTLKNVVVTDFVPALAKVVRRFDTLVPDIRRRDIGTQLKWKIKKMKPGEERIITYIIKPVIEITGELKLPKAHFTYETRRGKKKRIASKSILVRAKVK